MEVNRSMRTGLFDDHIWYLLSLSRALFLDLTCYVFSIGFVSVRKFALIIFLLSSRAGILLGMVHAVLFLFFI